MDINGVTCIKGEIHSLMTLMRLNTRWAAPSRFSRELLIQDESPLIQSFRRLNEYLEDTYDLRDVDCVVYLDPFLQVVVSEHASGPLTSAALGSLNKFALYGFLSSDMPRASEGINLTAQCISSCVFEETDWESDEIILVKLLELSSTCLRCEASSMLTVNSAWDIFSTCLSIHGQFRASKLLRSEAETALRHLTLTAFGKAENVIDRTQPAATTSRLSEAADLAADEGEADEASPVEALIDESTNINEVTISSATGLTFFLRKIMLVLSQIMDPQTQSPEQVKFALTLVNIALEAGGPSLGLLRPLVDILRGDVCRHLLRTSQSDDMAIFSLALRVVFNLFVSIKDHMKVQLEVFLTSVHLRLLSSSSFTTSPSSGSLVAAAVAPANASMDNNGVSVSLAKEELALESLLEFCREPSLMHDLYTNYDCDVQCTNLFDSIITTLCARALPSGTHAFYQSCAEASLTNANGEVVVMKRYVNILNRLSFEGVLLVLHAVAVRCWSTARYNNTAIPKKKSAQNLVKIPSPTDHSTPSKRVPDRHDGLNANGLHLNDINDSAHSPVSSNRDSSFRVPGDVGMVPAFMSRNISLSSSEQNFYHDDGFTSDPDNEDEDDFLLMARLKTAEVLRQRKIKKQKFRLVAEKFNEKPLNGAWVRFAADLGLLPKIPATAVEGKGGANLVDAKTMAKFLKATAGLDKACVGEFLSKGPKDLFPYHTEVLKEYVNTFEFWKKGKAKSGTFVKALRTFLGQFRLPGEAQCIDRLMEAFANRLFDQLGPNNPFVSADAAFILAFSTIMLNTDLHNPGIPDKKRMKREEFLRNNRGINGNADLPQEYLETLYDEIKERQIQVDMGIADQAGANAVDMIADTQHWDKLIRRADADQTPASFTPTVAARRYKRSAKPKDGRGSLVGLGSQSFRRRDNDADSAGKDATSGILENDNFMDDNISASSMSEVCPSSIHDGDMFHVMAQPVLDALHSLWETTDDPQLLCRIIEGIWDYASICAVLKFPDQFNKLVRIIADKARTLIESGSEDVAADIFEVKLKKTDVGNGMSAEKRGVLKGNMKKLIKADFDTILMSRKKNAHDVMYQLVDKHRQQSSLRGHSASVVEQTPAAAATASPEDILWEGSQYMRGQLLLRTLFHICNKYVSLVGPAGWTALIRILLWCRRRGDLPDNLVEIDDFSDARGGPLEPSIYAERCHNGGGKVNKNGNNAPGSEKGSSLWSSVTGLFWAAGNDMESDESNARVDIVGGKHKGGKRSARIVASHVLPHHPLLKETMTACRVDALLFLRIRDLSETSLISVVSCIIDELDGIYRINSLEHIENKISSGESGNISDSDNPESNVNPGLAAVTIRSEITIPELPRVMCELDGVMVIEWVSRLMFANMHRTKAIWARLHEFFSAVLERHVDEASEHCPYLLERCVVAIVRAAIHLLHFSSPLTISGTDGVLEGKRSSGNVSSESGEDQELVKAVWSSLRLLKGIPGDVVCHLSDRLGAGLLTFIRGSPECSSIRTLEQWYLIFSLLSAVSAGKDGRPFVWEAVGYLVDNNLISDLNFSPCRHLVLRFLYRVFPGEVDEEARLQQGMSHLSERNPWLTGSLVHLLRLALMACGGYELGHTSDPPDKSSGINYTTFPFEDNEEVSLLSMSSLPTSNSPVASRSKAQGGGQSKNSGSASKIGTAAGGKAGSSVINVVCVRFTHQEEVQLLLVETVKTFSDFVSVTPLAVSKHASFCLQVLLSSCKRISIKSVVWASMVKEMINRLPLNYMKATEIYESRCPDPTEIDTLCLKSCNITFEAITLNFRALRGLDEFQNLWLSFLSLLSLNINGLLELRLSTKLPLLSEFVEMLVALLRFLVPDTTSGPNSTFIVTQRHQLASESVPVNGGRNGRPGQDDISLLHLTWNSILGVCPGMPHCLRKNHSYMLDILSRDPDRYVFPVESLKGDIKQESAANIFPILSPVARDVVISVQAEVMVVQPQPVIQMVGPKENLLAESQTAVGDDPSIKPKANAVETMTKIHHVEAVSSSSASPSPMAASPVGENGGDYSRMRKIDARTHIV